MRSPYEILGVSPRAKPAVIKRAYRKLAAASHPDRNPGDPDAETRAREINAAWAVLSDPARRKCYDETGRDDVPQHNGDAAVVAILVPHLFAVMQSAPRESLGRMDVVAVLRDRVEHDAAAVRQSRESMRDAVAKIDAVLSRLSVRDGDDVFAGPLESERRRVENAIADADARLGNLENARAYLKNAAYRTDKPASGGTAATTGAFAQLLWSTG